LKRKIILYFKIFQYISYDQELSLNPNIIEKSGKMNKDTLLLSNIQSIFRFHPFPPKLSLLAIFFHFMFQCRVIHSFCCHVLHLLLMGIFLSLSCFFKSLLSLRTWAHWLVDCFSSQLCLIVSMQVRHFWQKYYMNDAVTFFSAS
jgi:hypothetical protein